MKRNNLRWFWSFLVLLKQGGKELSVGSELQKDGAAERAARARQGWRDGKKPISHLLYLAADAISPIRFQT